MTIGEKEIERKKERKKKEMEKLSFPPFYKEK